MTDKKYILKRNWISRKGYQTTLYLGYYNNRIACVETKEDALIMTKEEADGWLIVLCDNKLWTIEKIDKKQIEENSNEVSTLSSNND